MGKIFKIIPTYALSNAETSTSSVTGAWQT